MLGATAGRGQGRWALRRKILAVDLTIRSTAGIYPYMESNTCLCTALRLAALTATERYDAALAPSGLKVTMFRVLSFAEGDEAPTITSLAAKLGLERSTVGRNLKVLERQGLIAFNGGEDERAKFIDVTPKGRAAIDAARPLWRAAQDEMRALLGPDDADALLKLTNDLTTQTN